MVDSRNELLEGDIKKTFFKYLLPSIAGMLGNSLYILGDTIMIGQALGGPGLAAVNLSLPMFKLMNSIGLIFGVGGATSLAVSRGRGDLDRGNEIFNISMLLATILGLILTVIGLFFLDEITWLLGATDFSYKPTRIYLKLITISVLPTIWSISLGLFIRNDGNPNLVMLSSLAASFFNLVFDYILIFKYNLGIWGGAFATAVSPVIAVLILSSHFLKGKNSLYFEKVKLNRPMLKRIVQNGFPSSIIEFSIGIVVFLFNIVITILVGDIGISAYGIIANLSLVASSIFNGIGQAIQPIVSINHGARKENRSFEAVRLGIITAIASGTIFYLIGLIFPEKLAGLFTREQGALVEMTSRGIKFYFISFIFMGVNIVLTSYIQSMENYEASTIISLLRGSIYVAIVLFVLSKLIGMDGVWLTIPLVELITLITCYFIYEDFKLGLKAVFKKV